MATKIQPDVSSDKKLVKTQVETTFCDNTTHVSAYDETSFGMLASRQLYTEMVESGLDTSVLNKAPHVTQVIYLQGDEEPAVEVFACRCQTDQRRELPGAAS